MPIRGKWIEDKTTGKLVPYERKESTEAHNIITDEIPGGLESMVTGKIHTSKSSLRAEYRQHGVIEKGNDRNTSRYNVYESEQYARKMREDCEAAYYLVRDKMAPMSELDRERCKIMDENREKYCYDRRSFDRDGNPRE